MISPHTDYILGNRSVNIITIRLEINSFHIFMPALNVTIFKTCKDPFPDLTKKLKIEISMKLYVAIDN